MHRFLTVSFIALALFISAAGTAPAAHAQSACTAGYVQDTQSNYYQSDGTTPCTLSTGSGTAAISNTSTTTSCPENQTLDFQTGNCVSVSANGTVTDTGVGPSASGAKQPLDPNLGKADADKFGTVMIWIMSLFAWLVGVAALTLDYAVYYTVVTMGDYIHKLSAVGVTWRILRDLGNIMLIFGFLAIGITTILNVGWYGGGKKMLPMLLIAAVFLNFSLFISEAVIDTGNLFATQFFTQINGGTLPTATGTGVTGLATNGVNLTTANEGISNKIMGQLGLQTIYNAGTVNPDVYLGGNTWLIGFMGIILFITTAFVMFSLAFILIARFVILLFLIIIAPIGFAGLAVPQLKSTADKWWSKLFEQTITAPILLLLLYIALAVITDAQFLTGSCGSGVCTKNWVGFVKGNDLPGFASMMLSFLVAMGLLLAVTIVAKRLSAFGAAGATKLAGKLTFGATALGMRSTVGWGLNSAARRFSHSKLARVPVIGRAFSGALDRGAKASFDIRGATIGGGLKGIGADAGKAQEGGYRKEIEEAIKGREEHAKTLKLSTGEEVKAKKLEDAAEAAKDAYEADKTVENKLAMKRAQKAASDARGAAQLGYAKGLETMPWGWLYRNEQAAKNIRKTVEKSKDQKQIDALMDTIKNASGSGAGSPPPPPPTGGGGAPKP